MELDKDFKEFVELLNSNNVEYLVVGGYSVAHHGFPRYTGDFDIWINPTELNAKRTEKALQEFGFGSFGLSYEDFLVPDKVIQFGVEPVRIDLLTTISGLKSFDRAFENRDRGVHGKLNINYISYNDLIINKKSTNRLQDQRDVEELIKVKGKSSK